MNKSIIASAPGKLMLFGDHAVVYGCPAIVTAVDQRIYVTVRKNGVDAFQLEAPDLGLRSYTKVIKDLGKKELPKAVSFMEMLYKRFLDRYPQSEGIVVTTRSDFSSTFGFGSSSAVTVAFAKALTSLYEISVSNHELFELCYQAVLDVQGVGSGFDIASAIWGGTIYYVKPAKVVTPIDIDHCPLIVGYTGIKADTPTLVRMVETLKKEHPELVDDIFSQIHVIVDQAKFALESRDWALLGELMTQNQLLLQKLQVSSIKLDQLIEAANQAGALGGKLSGAGGGDCMLATVTDDNRQVVQTALTEVGATIMHVQLQAEGVRLESI